MDLRLDRDNCDGKSNAVHQPMERFGGSLPVKGYSGELAGKKRVQLPADHGKGLLFCVYV